MSMDAHIEDLTNAIVSCGNLLVREAARIFRPHGITPAQFNVLNLLRIAGEGMRPSEVAEKLVVDPASTTYLMKQVEERGWIRRVDDQADRRAYRIVLTREGKAKVEEALPIYQAALAETARQLGERPQILDTIKLLADLPAAAIEATEASAKQFPDPREPAKSPARKSASRKKREARRGKREGRAGER